MKIKAIIFDMDGVLIDSEAIWKDKEPTYLKSVAPKFNEEDRRNIIGGSIQRTHQYIKDKYSTEVSLKEFEKGYINFGIENVYKYAQTLPNVVELLKKLKEKNYPIALASSSAYPWINMALDNLNLRKYFNFIISADDLKGKGKPAPDIYLQAAKGINQNPENCLVFEDSTHGVRSGKAAGMTVYAIRNGFNDDQDLSDADLIFNDFSEIEINLL